MANQVVRRPCAVAWHPGGAMSLTRSAEQGEVYRQIIDKVILQAQTDFEEGGYTQETLQELKLVSDRNCHLPRTSAWLAAIREFTLSSSLDSIGLFKRCNMDEKWWEWVGILGAETVSA